jgi:uncharacterized SAM-binding protein YcdF (DUF218 family)
MNVQAISQRFEFLRRWKHRESVLRVLAWGVVCILVFHLSIVGLIITQGTRDEVRQADAAIVLGAAQWNGDPSPVLEARLNHALDLYRRGIVNKIILTGGVGEGDAASEASVSQKYLIERQVPAQDLLLDEESVTTWQNIQNAAEIARLNGINSVIIVSDPFHMLRSLKMSRDLQMNAYGSPTRSSPISRNQIEELRYVFRESWAYVAYIFFRV